MAQITRPYFYGREISILRDAFPSAVLRFREQSWSCVATLKHFMQQRLLVSSRNAGESALRDEVKQRPRRRLQEVKLALRLCFHNPVHPNFIMHILQIVLFTFPEALIRKKFVY